jgi:prepilin-type N-terminal cleavage/methylation domain-containing protein
MRRETILAKPPPRFAGFTLIEIMVAVAVLVILILFVVQLTNSATAITRIGTKHMDADTQARTVLDRLGFDIGRMIRRNDLDYYIKGAAAYTGHGNGHGWGHRIQGGQQGSDQCAFFASVPGYYPQSSGQGPISLVAYRINQNSTASTAPYLQMERMGKGLLWSGVITGNPNPNTIYPILFLPNTISSIPTWSAAIKDDNSSQSIDADYEVIGPNVFRFEYWYLLKSGILTDVPWDQDTTLNPLHTSLNGWTDVQAIAVAIAVIDPASRALIPSSTLLDIASDLDDFKSAPGRGIGAQKKVGDVEYRWNTVLFGDPADPANTPGILNRGTTTAGSAVPREVVKSIRVYVRYYDLREQ